jgi:chromosome segregation ATPase
MLLIVGATFFSFTLYSGEIIAALVKSNILSINLEEISDDVGSKNRKMIANRQLEETTSKLENVEKLLLDSSSKLSKLEMARNGLQMEEEKLKQSIEKLKFELVDQQNKKKLAENKKGKTESELKLLKKQNDQLKEKINALDEVALEKNKLESAFNNLEKKNRILIEQVKSVPDKEKLLERSEELKQKIVSLNEQLTTQKMLIEGYESNQQIQLNSISGSEPDSNDNYKKLILDLKKEHRNEVGRLKSEIARTEKYRVNFDELNGIKVVFSGFMGYDLERKEIIFMTREGQKIMMVQDNFTGTLVGECGLPVISSENETRCAATIIARLLFHKDGPIMKGLEIVEVIKK